MAAGRDFESVYQRLRAILEPYAGRMHMTHDSPAGYGLDLAPVAARNPTTWFAGVRSGKAYVSYYLMPVYVEPALLDAVSPALRRRMQGKSCFNFTSIDDALFKELADLTRRSWERTGGDPSWGVARRDEHGMAHRRAMSDDKRP